MSGIVGNGFMGRFKGVDPCAYVPGLYTQAEVDDLINIDGYIPVADADEFDKIRTGAVETMGGCSIWAGSYTTGGNKKYIQIYDIDLSTALSTPTPINTLGTRGRYDGNELIMDNYTSTQGIFTVGALGSAGDIVNCRVANITISGGVGNDGGLIDTHGGGLVDNCQILSGSITTGGISSTACGGIIGTLFNITESTIIQNCKNYASISGSAAVAGICPVGGSVTFPMTITNCENHGTITVTAVGGGGITSLPTFTTITNCQNFGDIIGSTLYIGGIVGRADGGTIIQDCTTQDCTISNSNVRTGGIAGGLLGNAIIRRCKVDNVTINSTHSGTLSYVGGICGYTVNATGAGPLITESEFINSSITGVNARNVGGILGGILNTFANVTNCFVRNCTVSAAQIVGGLVGSLTGASSNLTNCWGNAPVTGSVSVGGAVGTSASATTSATYWDTDVSGNATSAAGTGQTTVALQTPTSNTGIYSAWDAAIWDFGTSTDYPKLINTP